MVKTISSSCEDENTCVAAHRQFSGRERTREMGHVAITAQSLVPRLPSSARPCALWGDDCDTRHGLSSGGYILTACLARGKGWCVALPLLGRHSGLRQHTHGRLACWRQQHPAKSRSRLSEQSPMARSWPRTISAPTSQHSGRNRHYGRLRRLFSESSLCEETLATWAQKAAMFSAVKPPPTRKKEGHSLTALSCEYGAYCCCPDRAADCPARLHSQESQPRRQIASTPPHLKGWGTCLCANATSACGLDFVLAPNPFFTGVPFSV